MARQLARRSSISLRCFSISRRRIERNRSGWVLWYSAYLDTNSEPSLLRNSLFDRNVIAHFESIKQFVDRWIVGFVYLLPGSTGSIRDGCSLGVTGSIGTR